MPEERHSVTYMATLSNRGREGVHQAPVGEISSATRHDGTVAHWREHAVSCRQRHFNPRWQPIGSYSEALGIFVLFWSGSSPPTDTRADMPFRSRWWAPEARPGARPASSFFIARFAVGLHVEAGDEDNQRPERQA